MTRRDFSAIGVKAASCGAAAGLLPFFSNPIEALPHGLKVMPPGPPGQSIFLKYQDVKWEKIIPEMGELSPTISILRIDPKSQATQLMIRAPKNFHVPRHWHSANETHTIVSGTFIMECEGQREELGPGSFNYMPGKMIHQGWTKPDEDLLLFITVDAAWDIHWVDAPPQSPKGG